MPAADFFPTQYIQDYGKCLAKNLLVPEQRTFWGAESAFLLLELSSHPPLGSATLHQIGESLYSLRLTIHFVEHK